MFTSYCWRKKQKSKKLRRKNYTQKKLEKLQGVPKMTKFLMITNMISQNNQKLHYKVLTSKFNKKKSWNGRHKIIELFNNQK